MTPPGEPVRVTGVQAAQVAIAQLIHGWREQLSPREYVVMLELLFRFLADERERVASTADRWGIR